MRIGNLECCVKADLKRLEEYDVRLSKDGKKGTAWIASKVGQEFYLVCADPHKRTRATCSLDVEVEIDGLKSGLHIIEKNRKTNKIYIRDVLVSSTESRKFQFGALDLTDDDAYLYTSQRRIGEIVVKFWRSCINGLNDEMDADTAVQDPTPVHEREKKGFLHVVRLGKVDTISAQSGITARKLDDEPLAVFTFYYRGIDVLRADGIAPKPPSEELVSLCSTLEFASTSIPTAVKRKASEELLPELPKVKVKDEEFKPASRFIIQPHTPAWTTFEPLWYTSQRVDCRHGKKEVVKSEKASPFVPGEVIDLTGE
ncbi:uncharacterized protein SCHCODRAFT_02642636 [Schizophyllum commune H4-8]|nr:uncharacterized protein SCHCODRAFT_02642636 [Schizophyllum commune H4-8]KAI5885855.1 hypothetical protein SCHCODRAFT_02642636 [Schizophyllum commune H4-8]